MEPPDIMIFEVIIGVLLLGYLSILSKDNAKEMNSFMSWILGTLRIGNCFRVGFRPPAASTIPIPPCPQKEISAYNPICIEFIETVTSDAHFMSLGPVLVLLAYFL